MEEKQEPSPGGRKEPLITGSGLNSLTRARSGCIYKGGGTDSRKQIVAELRKEKIEGGGKLGREGLLRGV